MAWRHLATDRLLLAALLSEQAKPQSADLRPGASPKAQVADGGEGPTSL